MPRVSLKNMRAMAHHLGVLRIIKAAIDEQEKELKKELIQAMESLTVQPDSDTNLRVLEGVDGFTVKSFDGSRTTGKPTLARAVLTPAIFNELFSTSYFTSVRTTPKKELKLALLNRLTGVWGQSFETLITQIFQAGSLGV